MFYLTTHSTHLVTEPRQAVLLVNPTNTLLHRQLALMPGRKGNVLFNDALNTFIYGYRNQEGNVLFNDALNTFSYGYRNQAGRALRIHCYIVNLPSRLEGKEMFYLTTHSTHLFTVIETRKEMFYLTTHSTHLVTEPRQAVLLVNSTNTLLHRQLALTPGRKGKEMFYLMTHSTHLVMVIEPRQAVLLVNPTNTLLHRQLALTPGRKGNVSFNDALKTFSYGYRTPADRIYTYTSFCY